MKNATKGKSPLVCGGNEDHRVKNTFYSAVFMVGVYTNVVFASPTANEFNKCTELESAYVASCLRANDKNCLIKAAEVKKRCINQVIQQHNRDSPERKSTG